MSLTQYLGLPFAQHALLAAALVAIACGLIGPFVITRGMAFAVHGTSELAFTGAAAGLLLANNAIAGALVGAVVVGGLIGAMGVRERERDSSIGVILAAGMGLGVLLLSFYHGFATEATNILFGDIFGVSGGQLLLLVDERGLVVVRLGGLGGLADVGEPDPGADGDDREQRKRRPGTTPPPPVAPLVGRVEG